MPREEPMINVQDIHFRYDPEQPSYAVDGVSLAIHRGEFVAVRGANGCGKSTLAKHFNAILLPEAGTVLVEGMDTRNEDHLYDVRQKVGMVFQKANPFPVSIFDNVAYGPRTHGIRNKQKLEEIVENSLRSAAIWDEVKDQLKKSALALSGGQQQRVLLARALCAAQKILLLDEPVSGLDPRVTADMYQLIRDLNKKDGITIIMISHDIAAAIKYATHILHIGEN